MPNWKKVIVSGSDAVLNNATLSGNLNAIGNISSSATTTTLNLIATGSGTDKGNVTATGTGSFAHVIGTKIVGALTGDVVGDVTGDLTGQADTVATIAGLAPNTATTQATQGNITSVGTLTSITSTGASVLGNAVSDTHTFTGHITASGNISASGTIFTPKVSFNNGDITLDNSSGNILEFDGGHMRFKSNVEARFGSSDVFRISSDNTDGDIRSTGDLKLRTTSATGDILLQSGSTTMFSVDGGDGRNKSFQHLQMSDGKALYAGNGLDLGIYHVSNNTNIENTTGDLTISNTGGGIVLGGSATQHVTASGNISASGNLSAGGGTLFLGDDVSIFDDGTNILRTDDVFHANNNIHVGGDGKLIDRADTDNFIELAGTINMSTDISVIGNISASATTTTLNLIATGSGAAQGNITATGTGSFTHVDINGNITASGKITAEQLTSTDDITAAGLVKAGNLTLIDLSAQNSEATALMINGSNVVGTRELTSNAFSTGTIGTTTAALTGGSGILSAGTFTGATARTFSIDSASIAPFFSASLNNFTTAGNISGGLEATASFGDSRFTGKVGINRDEPLFSLHVVGSIYANQGSIFVDSGNRIKWGNSQQFIEGTNGSSLELGAGNSTQVFITGSGKVGIGTTSPSQKLHVDGHALISAEKYYYVAGTGAGFGSDASGNFKIRQNDADLIFGSGNNVGIGTTTPTEKLQVQGNISASGTGSFKHGIFNNPSPVVNEKILQVQKAGSNVFYVDEDGDGVFGGIIEFKNFIYGASGNTFVGGRQDLVLGMNWNNDEENTSIKFTKNELNNDPSNTLMVISSSGNVGIGNTTPASAKLVIREDSNHGLRLEDASGHYFRVNTGGNTEIRGNVTVGGNISSSATTTTLNLIATGSGTDKGNVTATGTGSFAHVIGTKIVGALTGNVVGDVTGDVTGTADTATVATTVTITDNENANENNPLIFVAGGDLDGGNLGLESDGDLHYNPSTGVLSVTGITAAGFNGDLTGDVTGDLTGQADTVATIAGLAPNTATTQATQASITTAANLTTVGALNAGSITSGFTSIDVGSGNITTTGTVTSANYVIGTHTIDDIDISEEFVDADAHIMSSKAIGTRFARINADTTGNAATADAVNAALTAGGGVTAGGTFTGATARTFSVNSGSILPFYSGSIFNTISGDVSITAAGVATVTGAVGTTTAALTVDNATVKLNSGTTFNGADALTLSAKTAAIANGGAALATADQIHTFVTTQTDEIDADTAGNAATADAVNNALTAGTGLNNGGGTFTGAAARTFSINSASFAPFFSASLNNFTTAGNISGGLEATASFGHILMPEQSRISFDNESSNDQFIKGTDNNITIDGDNFVNLEADVSVNNETPLVTATGNISASGDHTALNLIATGSNNLLNTSQSGHIIGNRFFEKSSTADYFLAQGDIIYTGGGSTTKGNIVYMATNGNWANAQANAASTSTSLLGIALGTSSGDGILLRGTVTLDHDVGNNQGVQLFLSDTAAGNATATRPASSGDVVRIIGYNLGDNDEIWFNPDNTFVEVA